MIAFLKGVLAGKMPTRAYIDVNGVGYAVGMSANSLSKLPEVGQPVQVFTHLQVREDGVSLYGFASQEEQALFEKLIGVSGIGPKVALSALSSFTPQALADAIATQDVARVQKIPGVGKKSAQRIILELKGSLDQGIQGLFSVDGQASAAADPNSAAKAGATEALLSMGFTSEEAEVALRNAPSGADEGKLLQYALKRLGSMG